MQETEKFTSNKDIIAFLAEQFPACFSLKGEAKPLKIGIFDDLSQRLAEEPRISKTRLRSALRHYTSSWRYLRSMKPGKQRVDLDGNPCGELEQQHADHAKKALEESLAKHGIKPNEAKAGEGREKRAPRPRRGKPGEGQDTRATKDGKTGDSRPAKSRASKVNYRARGTKPAAGTTNAVKVAKATAELKPVDPSQLQNGQQVQVKVGGSVVSGTVLELTKGDVQVQLASGMQVRVKKAHIVA